MLRTRAKQSNITAKSAEGFTIVEVMLVLGISSLLLIGLIGGTFASIARQRYNDSVRDFAEYLRTVYSEVISPQSLGLGNSSEYAILGKILVFGSQENDSTIYSATIVGNAKIPHSSGQDFLAELQAADSNVSLLCGNTIQEQTSTVASYTPLWQSEFVEANDPALNTTFGNKLKGTLLISRSLTSATVHTAFLPEVIYDLPEQCTPENNTASTLFKEGLTEHGTAYAASLEHATSICVKSDDSAIAREIRISADGRNTSAIHIIDEDPEGEESRCRKL